MTKHYGPFGRVGEPDPYTRIPITLPQEVCEELCNLLKIEEPERRAQLRDEIEHWGAVYQRWVRQEKTTPDVRAQRKILEKAIEAARSLRNSVCVALDGPDSSTALISAYVSHQYLKGDAETVGYDERIRKDLEHLTRLEAALKTALDRYSVRRGPKQARSLYFLVQQLCLIFERYAGEKATHNPYRRTEYNGRPGSLAGQFALIVVRAIDPTVRPTQLSTAMRYVLRSPSKVTGA